MYKNLFLIFYSLLLLSVSEEKVMSKNNVVRLILEKTEPLKFSKDKRFPLYVWSLTDLGTTDEKEAIYILQELDKRGFAVSSVWNPADKEKTLTRSLYVAKLQKKLGLPVNINATSCMYSFFNGDTRTAHVSDKGTTFFDYSFSKTAPIGCPFTLDYRITEMKKVMEYFVSNFKKEGVPIDFIFADWEIDGPIEWNDAWESSKKCKVCRRNIRNIDDFSEFQKTVRTIRSRLQKEVFADTVKKYFPHVLVGNYAVYPHDGWRYWYDYFEKFVDGAPHKTEGNAKYRQWFHEFPLTGYTVAMPVVYTWSPIFSYYDFENVEYRWFYNLLLVATNACKSTPHKIPIISFVHWHTILLPPDTETKVKQFSQKNYKELLWHMLLRGVDAFFLWCVDSELEEEIRLLHHVYAESLQYKTFLEKGKPISFEVPSVPGPVVSGLKVGNKVLLRRTDFGTKRETITLKVNGKTLNVPPINGACLVLTLPR